MLAKNYASALNRYGVIAKQWISEYIILKMKVKNVYDLDENWEESLFCQPSCDKIGAAR